MAKHAPQRIQSTNRAHPHFIRPTAVALAVAACFNGTVLANPTAPTVVNGTASFATAGNILNITNSHNAIINWGSFSIGVNELTRFIQPSALSAVLNRVTGQDPSAILGALQSNGRVFLLNPNGIVFGAGSQINVAGLVASTLNLSNDDFLNNRMKFTDGAGAGSVVNNGSITGGSVYLVGNAVTNNGLISSPNGEVVLAAGNSVELVNPGTPNLRVEIVAPDNEARNLGTITAEAGRIGIYAGLINNSGTIRADSVVSEGGKILLKATNTALLENGSIVSAQGIKGGRIEILGNLVGLTGNASVDVSGDTGGGTVLIGGDYQGKNPDVQNAFRTYVGPDATIKADAITSGDGGKVVVWSDDATRFYGNISARGGVTGGDGGFVEVSGKRWLDFNGLADTRAPYGATGTLLLDPSDITIDNIAGNTGSFDGDPFYLNGTLPSHIQWAIIAAQLVNSNAIISTSSGAVASEAGNITVAADSPDLASPNRLELLADNNIFVNGKITNTDAASVVVLSAGNNIEQNANGAITAGGLLAQAGGSVLLDTAPNMVGTLAGAGGTFRFRNGQSLTIGSVGGVNGVTSQSSNAVVDITVTTGNLTVNQNVTAEGNNSSDPASVRLTASTGSITLNGPVSVSALGGGTESGGAAEVIMTAGTTIAVNAGTTVQAIGGDGSCCGNPGNAAVSLVAPGGITVNGTVLARGGNASDSYNGGDATIDINGGAIAIGGSVTAYGGNVSGYDYSSPGRGGVAEISLLGSGLIDITGTLSARGGYGNRAGTGQAGNGGDAGVFVTSSAGGITVASGASISAYGGQGGSGSSARGGDGGAATVALNAYGNAIQLTSGTIGVYGGRAGSAGSTYGGGGAPGGKGGDAWLSVTTYNGHAIALTDMAINVQGGGGGDGSAGYAGGSGGAGGHATAVLTANGGGNITISGGSLSVWGGDGGSGGRTYGSSFSSNFLFSAGGRGGDGGHGLLNVSTTGAGMISAASTLINVIGGDGRWGGEGAEGGIGGLGGTGGNATANFVTLGGGITLTDTSLIASAGFGGHGGSGYNAAYTDAGVGGQGGTGGNAQLTFIANNGGSVLFDGGTSIIVDGSEGGSGGRGGGNMYGGPGGPGGNGGNGGTSRLDIATTGGGAVTLSTATLLVRGGNGGSGGDGGTGSSARGAGGNGGLGNSAALFVQATGGSAPITLTDAGITVNQGLNGSGGSGSPSGMTSPVMAAADTVFSAAGALLLNGNSSITMRPTGMLTLASASGGLTISQSTVGSGALVLSSGADISFDNNSYASGATGVSVSATGSLSLVNSSLSGGGVGAYINTGGNVTVDGGGIYGYPDIKMSVGGVINMNNGGTISAGLPSTIYLTFPMLTSGGYFVNGVEGVVWDPNSFTGFCAQSCPAILGTNLLVTYGGGTTLNIPTDTLIVAMGESTKPPDPEKDKNVFKETEDEKKKDAPVCR